jgi:hypothetical protein
MHLAKDTIESRELAFILGYITQLKEKKTLLIGYDLSQVHFWSRQFKEQGTSSNAYYICIIV